MTTATQQQQLATGAWSADKVHSQVGFEVGHMLVSTFRGRFDEYDVTLDGGRLSGSVDVASVDVREPNLAAHLQSPEFFDAERHPRLLFESSDLEPGDGGELTVRGDLTIKGVTRPVVGHGRYVRVEQDVAGGERIGLTLETTIDRREFGLDWNAPLPKGGFALDDEVKLVIALELVPAGAE